MNKELQNLLTDLEKFIYQNEKDKFTLDIHQVHLILDHVANQGEEITRLNEENKTLKELEKYTMKEITRLNNIINELEKCLDKNIELNYYKNGVKQYNKTLTEGAKMFRDYIKEHLKELKEGKK